MDTKFGAVLARSQEAGRAVGAFTCYDLLGFEAVVRAAESRRAPVVVLVSPSSFGAEGGERLVRALVAASRGALVEVMRRVDRALPLSFVLAKGGITSSDLATKGLDVRRAEVAGPLLPPGIVPVWILPEENDFPRLPYVIFPGNVGGPDSLAQAIEILRGER